MRTVNVSSRLVCTCLFLCCATRISEGVVWDTVVFRDDFNYGPGPPDPEKWIVNHPECVWPQCTQWLQGRTRFPNPTPWLATGEFPIVENGVLVIRHHLFDPYDSGGANGTFLGGEVHTRQEFRPDRPYRFEARVKLDLSTPNGLVTSFFTYGFYGCRSDEIDFEFLSNKINNNVTYPNGDPVLTNSWNESHECPQYVFPDSLDLTGWNTFWIYWYPQPDTACPHGGCVQWWWLDPVNGETWLRTEEGVTCVPDEPMALYFNFWAPCYTGWSDDCDPWDEAADRNLQPVNTSGLNQRYEIDYVEVRTSGPANFNSEVKLFASDAAVGDLFGESVSVSGNTAVVGAPSDDDAGTDSGSAYVFVRTGSVWTQQQKLTASDAAARDYFGIAVSVSGDTVLVGADGDDDHGFASGSAYIFRYDPSRTICGRWWCEEQKLTASDAAGVDQFGNSVSVSGDTAVVGAFRDDNYTGSAYVFVRSGGVWTQQQKLTASDAAASDRYGHSVSVSGDTAVVGATQTFVDGFNPGSAYVFVRAGTLWTEQQKLTASDAAANDSFGSSVSVSGDTAVVGADLDSHPGKSFAGSAYVFVRSGKVWNQQQMLTASDARSGDLFGVSVSLSGDTTVVGAYHDGEGGAAFDLGSAYVFVRSGGIWTEQQKLTASDAAAGDEFGNSVSVSGDTAVVGAYQNYNSESDSGSAYVYTGYADSDGDGVCDADDLCPCTPPCVAVDAQGRPFSDLDPDCDTDLLDFQLFQQRFDGDLVSWKFFQQGFTGPNQP